MTADSSRSRGSATVWVLLAAALLLTAAGGLLVVVGVAGTRHRAQAAADLAARAGAAQRGVGGADPCFRAAVMASANGAELLACRVQGAAVVVHTQLGWGPLLGWLGLPPAQGRAVARAGRAWPAVGVPVLASGPRNVPGDVLVGGHGCPASCPCRSRATWPETGDWDWTEPG